MLMKSYCSICSRHWYLIQCVYTIDMPKKFKLGTYRKQKEERPESLSISLPLTSFTAAPLQSIDSLARRLTQTGGVPHGRVPAFIYLQPYMYTLFIFSSLKTGWTQIVLPNSLCFTKLDGNRTVPEMMFCVSIKEDMTWMLSSCGVAITSGRLINSLTSKLDSVSDAKSLLLRLDCCYICSGNADGKFQELLREPRFVKGSGKEHLYMHYNHHTLKQYILCV